MNSLFLAISFLTIFPTYPRMTVGERDMAKSLYFYPLVGFLIGGILYSLAYLGQIIPLGKGADAIIIVAWIIVTGGLHLDGLMDLADGIFSGKERQLKLGIMRDSRIGAMGVIAFGVILLLKFAFLPLLEYADKRWVLFIAPAAGRFIMVYSIVFYNYARSDSGLGKVFGDSVDKSKFWGAALILLIGGFLLAKTTGLLVITATFIIGAFIVAWIGKVLGGQTGDTYGAICEITETLFIIIAVITVALK